jgi:hypothetical protein
MIFIYSPKHFTGKRWLSLKFGTPYIQALTIDSMYERYAMRIMIETSLSVECLHITTSINSN